MAEIGHMNFFKVNKCGLYRHNQIKPKGCELEETFDLIQNWSKDRAMSDTMPWDVQSTNKSKCYCRGIYKDPSTKDFLLILWKSDTDSKGSLWGAEEDSANGSGEIVKYTNEYKGKKVIWGRPCYYWVIPSLNTVVSVKFDHSVCDSLLFQDYVISCITNRIDHPNRTKERTEGGHIRISYKDEIARYSYKFDVSLRSLNTSNAKLSDLAKNITHIIKRETININYKDQRADWLKKFSTLLPFVSSYPKSTKRQIEIRAEAKPTVAELKQIIETYAKQDQKKNGWDNVGFETEKGIAWVDKYRLKDEITISNKSPGVFNAEVLLKKILEQRENYIRLIKRSIKDEKESTAALAKEA